MISAARLDAWRAVLNVHAAVVARVEAALAEYGLPPLSWYDVLWALYRAPKRRLRMSEVADGLTISRSTFSRLADRLAAAGLIRFEPAPDDGRSHHAVLTAPGARMLRRMWPVYEAELEAAFAPDLSSAEARQVTRLLRRSPMSRPEANAER